MFPCDFVTRVTFVTKCKLTLFHEKKVTKSQKSQSHIVTNGDRNGIKTAPSPVKWEGAAGLYALLKVSLLLQIP